jgi:hypothetical protein
MRTRRVILAAALLSAEAAYGLPTYLTGCAHPASGLGPHGAPVQDRHVRTQPSCWAAPNACCVRCTLLNDTRSWHTRFSLCDTRNIKVQLLDDSGTQVSSYSPGDTYTLTARPVTGSTGGK